MEKENLDFLENINKPKEKSNNVTLFAFTLKSNNDNDKKVFEIMNQHLQSFCANVETLTQKQKFYMLLKNSIRNTKQK